MVTYLLSAFTYGPFRNLMTQSSLPGSCQVSGDEEPTAQEMGVHCVEAACTFLAKSKVPLRLDSSTSASLEAV